MQIDYFVLFIFSLTRFLQRVPVVFTVSIIFLNFTDLFVGDGIEINLVNNFYINKSFVP